MLVLVVLPNVVRTALMWTSILFPTRTLMSNVRSQKMETDDMLDKCGSGLGTERGSEAQEVASGSSLPHIFKYR